MSYLWNEFNIKTFPAETIVYRDGVFCDALSTIENGPIDKKYDLPVHIIYIGEIAGKCRLDIEISAENQPVFLSMKIKNKKPAFLDVFIKNTGKKSVMHGNILIENMSDLEFNCCGFNSADQTDVSVHTKLVAHGAGKSKLTGTATINAECEKCISDIDFAALALDENAKIEFMPAQRIGAVPTSAKHSASIYHPSMPQILYLRQSGLSGAEATTALREAFENSFELF